MADRLETFLRVLIVDGNPVDADEAERALGDGYLVNKAATAREARTAVLEARPDCVLLNEQLPHGSGLDLLREFARLGCPVVLLSRTGVDAIDRRRARGVARKFLDAGATDVISKWELQSSVLRRVIDMSVERQQAAIENEALARQGARFEQVLDRSQDFVGIADLQGSILYVNRGGLDMLSWPASVDVRGYPQLAFHPPLEARRLTREILPRVRRAGSWRGRLELLTSAGATIPTDACIILGTMAEDRPDFFALIARDVREQQHLAAQLQASQRMEAVGRLAGGVAHDFNNLLTAIVSFATFAQKSSQDAAVRDDLDEVLTAARRARELTTQLLSYSRQRAGEPELLEPKPVLEDTMRLVGRLVGEDIRLDLQVDDDAGAFSINPTAFDQVIVNLVVNARDAMPQGGTIELKACRLQVDKPFSPRRGHSVRPGDYVCIEVADTGGGIEPSVRQSLFDAFVTTKSTARGTGLGLSTCAAVVKEAGGWIWAESRLGEGTSFYMALPRLSLSDSQTVRLPELPADGGDETILLVEDNEQVRRPTARVLENYGYQVIEADSGDQAMDLSARHLSDIHLVLMDVVMPGLSGRALLKAVAAQRPSAKALFMSGYSLKEVADRGLQSTGLPLIEKPFTPEELARRVRSVLDEPGNLVSEVVKKRPRILVVEDDQSLVRSLRRVFREDFDMEFVSDSSEAIDLLESGSPFDGILCDYILPKKMGTELYQAVCSSRPELAERFVFISGAEEEVLAALEKSTHCPVLRKPASSDQMRSTLDDMLGRAS